MLEAACAMVRTRTPTSKTGSACRRSCSTRSILRYSTSGIPMRTLKLTNFPCRLRLVIHLPADQLPSAARVRRCEHGIGTWCFFARSEILRLFV